MKTGQLPTDTDPHNPVPNYQRIEHLLLSRQLDAACAECSALLKQNPRDARLLFYLGRSLLLQNKPGDAAIFLGTAFQLDSVSPDIAIHYFMAADSSGSQEAFARYLLTHLDEVIAVFQSRSIKGYPSECLGRALKTAAALIQADSSNWKTYWVAALIAEKMGNVDITVWACEKVLSLNKEFWFARELPKHAKGYYAQNGQDALIETYFSERHPRSKVFVEVGAFDGVHYSNVRRLVEAYGWRGICIEPVEKNFLKLQQSYSGRDVTCIRAAVSNQIGSMEMNVSTYPHLPQWGSDVASLDGKGNARWTQRYGAHWKKETVSVRTLTQILRENGIQDIGLLSIDAEGHDLEVLLGLDFEQYRPQLIVVEYGSQRAEILRLLAGRGYSLIHDNQQDLFLADIQPIQGGGQVKNYSGEGAEPYEEIQRDVEHNLCTYLNKPLDAPLRLVIVGAYLGLEIDRFLRRYPNAEILAFEPNPRTFENLQKKFASERRVQCYRYAVSDRNGTLEFFENNLPGTGSLLPIDTAGGHAGSNQSAEQYGIRQVEKFAVECIRLDEFEPLKNKPVDLLWCDVQGAELTVLHGAKRVLANCSALFLEVWCHATLYQGQARLIDLEGFLAGQGFVLSGIGLDHKIGNGSGNGFWLNRRIERTAAVEETVCRIEDIRGCINPDLFATGYLPSQGAVTVQRRPAAGLITPRRFDLMAKIIYGRFFARQLKSDWGERVYLAHLRAFNNLCERDGSGKSGEAAFLKSFQSLLRSVGAEGFDPNRSLIPTGNDGTLIDGSHRAAAGYIAGRDVFTAIFDRGTNGYDFSYFLNHGLERKYADAMAYEYCRIRKNTYIVTVFPCAKGKDQEVQETIQRHGRIVYRKEMTLTKNGPFFYIKHAYLGEHWTGTAANNFRGYRSKTAGCFRGGGAMRVYLVEAENLDATRACKNEIRELFNGNKDAVHINDSHEETLRLAGLCFNDNSVHFLNHAEMTYFEPFHQLLNEYRILLEKSGADKECFCIDGSSVMAAYGIRPARDIDYLHYGYEALKYKDPSLIESYNKALHYHRRTLEDVVFNPEHYFYYEGLKFVSLHELFRMKSNRTEPKNIADVPRIKPYVTRPAAPDMTPTAGRKPKIVGLVGARNEDRIIGQCLRMLSRFTDAVVFLDDCSTDNTLQTVRELAAECRVERILTKDRWERDEPGDRNRMLQAGREIGGTHFIVLDADEAFTSNLLQDHQLKQLIQSMQPGDQLLLNWIALWKCTGYYRQDQSVWTNNYKPFVFCDDGCCSYSSEFIHTPRVPANLKRGRACRLEGYEYGMLHFQFVNWPNLLLKQAWYRCLERIRNPQKPAAEINKRYAPSKDESGLHLEPSRAEWFSRYEGFDPNVYNLPDSWRGEQIRNWLAEYGAEFFRDIDIWDVISPIASAAGSAAESNVLVSAIVSTYNSETFIRGCLQDLVDQTLYRKGQLEIIVVNSGSEENEEAIVREFQSRYPNIRYLRTPRQTIYAAWNHGVRAARGKYLTNANTDDRHAPEMLEKLAQSLEENPDVSYVYSPFYITEVPNQTWQTKTPVGVSDWQREYSRESLLQRYYCGPQPMWKRSLHDEYGYFDERMKVAGDYEFALRISQTHKLKLVNEPLGLYYRSESSLERSAGTHNSERVFTILLYRQFRSTLIRRPLPNPAAEFSVILRNCSQGRHLTESIESVRRQTVENWELVIVDDKSAGSCADVVRQYLHDPRIKLIVHEKQHDVYGSTLAGIGHISAEVFGELDSGDLLAPNALERMGRAHREHAACGLIYSQKVPCDSQMNAVKACSAENSEGRIGLQPDADGVFRTYKLQDYLKAGMHDCELNCSAAGDLVGKMRKVTTFHHVQEPLCLTPGFGVAGKNESQPLVSVIIATHNRPESLKYAVASVLNQTYSNVQIIVVNDAGDPVDDLLTSLNMRGNIVSLRHDRNKGPAATRNTGLRAARGKYIAYLDDDDIFFANHIEVLVTGLESSAYRFAYTHAHRSHQVQQNGRYVEIGRSQPYGCSVTHDQLLVRNLIPTLCIMHERACIEEVGYFDETFRTHEDWDMWIRMSQKFEFLHIPELTAQITWRDDGTTTTSRMQEAFLAAPERMYLKHRDAAAGKPAVLALQAERLRILKGQASKQASSAAPVLAYPTAAAVQTASVETPAADIKPIGNAPARKYRIAIKFCTPSQKLRNWGDTWFARGLQRAFMQAGHECVMHSREEWDQPDEDIDVAIHLKGLNAYNPKPHCFNVIWIISHPELHTADELNRFDAVFCGSKKYLEHIKPQLKVPCWYLPQAADTTVFAPIEKAAEQDIDLLFVGSNYYQNKNRRIIADVLATGRDYNLWVVGPYWKGYIDDKYVKDEYVLPEKLAELYARTKIVLNDHHDTMKQWGFVNDRTYSLAASNVFQISDAVEGLDELGVVTYQTPEDLREKIDFYLANESERMQAAAAVHERCRAFSFSQAAERMLHGIGSQWAARAGRREQAIAITTPAEAATASQPKVSVIMSCHNGEKYLAETIDSLLAQTLQEWELLAIDDGSTDGTLSVLKFYAQKDGRIRLWRFEEKKGPYVRRNFAIRQARSEFISIQDADDLMHPEKLGALYECIRSNPRLAIVGSHHRRFRGTFRGEDFGDPIQRSCEHAEIMQGFKKSWQLCWHGSAIIRKSLFDTIGLYDEQPYGSDTFWLAKAGLYSLLTRSIEFRNVPKFLTYKREHGQSQTGTISPADPRNRRHYLEKYYINKLTEIAQNAVNNPNLDAAATLKACTCTEFIPVFGHMFEKWESEPVTEEMCRKMLERAAAQFAAEFYVSCLITLDRLEQMTGSQSGTWRNMNIITGLAAYASGDDELAAACLRKESRMNVSAADLLRRIESGAIPRQARQRRQDVKAVIASSQGMISIEVPSGLSELTAVRSARPILAGLPAGAERQDRQREACGYKV